MGRSMDWTLDDDMFDSLFFCVTFTGRRGGQTAFVLTGAGKSDAGAEPVKSDPGCSWKGEGPLVTRGLDRS